MHACSIATNRLLKMIKYFPLACPSIFLVACALLGSYESFAQKAENFAEDSALTRFDKTLASPLR